VAPAGLRPRPAVVATPDPARAVTTSTAYGCGDARSKPRNADLDADAPQNTRHIPRARREGVCSSASPLGVGRHTPGPTTAPPPPPPRAYVRAGTGRRTSRRSAKVWPARGCARESSDDEYDSDVRGGLRRDRPGRWSCSREDGRSYRGSCWVRGIWIALTRAFRSSSGPDGYRQRGFGSLSRYGRMAWVVFGLLLKAPGSAVMSAAPPGPWSECRGATHEARLLHMPLVRDVTCGRGDDRGTIPILKASPFDGSSAKARDTSRQSSLPSNHSGRSSRASEGASAHPHGRSQDTTRRRPTPPAASTLSRPVGCSCRFAPPVVASYSPARPT